MSMIFNRLKLFSLKNYFYLLILGLFLSVLFPSIVIAQTDKKEKKEKPVKKKKKKAKLPPEDISGAMLLNAQYSFTPSNLNGATISNPTSLQFGPDRRLYVSEQGGLIKIFTISKTAPNNYIVTKTEIITLINSIPNHNDDGSINISITKRQVTSILVKGTATNPVIYVSSSDSRIGGPSGDLNLDTNSGIVSTLTWNGTSWVKIDLVRGLPRSEENHSSNGMQLNDQTNTLYMIQGGNTNAGSPSTNFAYLGEYALSASVLSINLNAINAMTTKGNGNTAYKYDLPTLDDPTRTNDGSGADTNDPFGGNDGLNQAKIVAGGPVQIYAPGFRNAYDIVITKSGNMYTIDNGANQGWGGYPQFEGTSNVTDNYVNGEPGSTSATTTQQKVNNLDNLHFIGNITTYQPNTFYGGHPAPIRANPAGAGLYTHDGTTGVWRSSKTGAYPLPVDWPPVSIANPIEGSFKMPGVADNALLTFSASTNGLVEYTASNFGSTLKGSLLACSYDGNIVKLTLNSTGSDVTNPKDATNKLNQDLPFASNFGNQPLDVTVQSDGEIFPGTVWGAVYGSKGIIIFEPNDNLTCTGLYNESDDDGDHFTNADEIDNATQPCSASSAPPDNDQDFISDLNDIDDDNDGISDTTDLFALDPVNGYTPTFTRINYDLFNNYPGTGLFGLGFKGLMTNKRTDYSELYEDSNLVAGGAVGAFSIVNVSSGDCYEKRNNQENAFQFGIQAGGFPFTLESRILGPFFNNKTPVNSQSQGIYISNGDQDNYLKIVLNANGGVGGIQIVYENGGIPVASQFNVQGVLSASTIELFLVANPTLGTVQPQYSLSGGQVINVGAPIQVSGEVLKALRGTTAIGIIATSFGASPFTATWDYIYVTSTANTWKILPPVSGAITARNEGGYVTLLNKAFLIGGRGMPAVQEYNFGNNSWTNKATPPVELHHFQPVALNGLIYVVGAMNGTFPREKPVTSVYTYNPSSNLWASVSPIPINRARGGAGSVMYNNKIYTVGGIIDGHWTGSVKWFDEFDPASNTWKVLPDAPRTRDHFQAAMVNNKLYLIGGRRSSESTGHLYDLTVPEVDVYDFATAVWSTLPSTSNIPTQRAAVSSVVIDNEIIVIGGESGSQIEAHKNTEALNVTTNSWRRFEDLQQGRHGTGAVVNDKSIYIATGVGNRGGGPLLTTQEVYSANITSPNKLQVTTFTLVNSITDEDIQVIKEGDIFNLANLPSPSLNIRANTNPPVVGKVVFELTGKQTRTQIESEAPYSLFSDNNGNYNNWTPTVGSYTLKATPYSDNIAGIPLTLNFSVVNNTGTLKVATFTLVNSTTDQDIQTLTNGATLNTATVESINIRANTSPTTVGSTVFELTGPLTRKQVETEPPYALFGDGSGNYADATLIPGTYTLKCTPFSGSKGTGTAGSPLIVTFNVVNGAATTMARKTEAVNKTLSTESQSDRLTGYPNPSTGRFTVILPKRIQGNIFYRLISIDGSELTSGNVTIKKPTTSIDFDFSQNRIATGEYYLSLKGKELKTQMKIMLIK